MNAWSLDGRESDLASSEHAAVTSPDLDDVRTWLAVAAADASKALEEASQVARVVINDELRGQFSDAGLVTMKERLRVLRHALHDLENVHADLRRRADAAMGTPTAQAPAGAPPVAPRHLPTMPPRGRDRVGARLHAVHGRGTGRGRALGVRPVGPKLRHGGPRERPGIA